MKKTDDYPHYNKEEIEKYLIDKISLSFFSELNSTNSYLKEINTSKDQRIAVIAEKQSMGRGRYGNSFLSDGGIYLSIKLFLNSKFTDLSCLTAFAGVKVCNAITQVCSISPSIKWVNDIIFKNKKIGGILAEFCSKDNSVIIGVGINSDDTPFPPELANKAGSITCLTGKPVDKSRLAAAIINNLFTIEHESIDKHNVLISDYRSLCSTIGKDIIVCAEPPYKAKAIDIDDDCSLIVADISGNVKKVFYGEIKIKGKEGYI